MDEQIAQKRHAIHSSGAGRVDVHPFPENPPDGLHGSVVKLLHGKEITPVPIRWLWDGWLAAGKTHILGGAPGVGKSTLALSLAAVLSIGGRWPDGQRARPGSVAIWSGEDDPRDTLAPRLLASGADMGRIFFVDSVFDGLERRSFDPARDMAPLRRKLLEVGGIRLLIVDPVVSAIAGDSHKNAEVRRGLQPLADLAESLDCALLGITHFSKGTRGNDPVERLNGSIALGAVARVVLVAAKHQAPDEEGRVSRVLCRAKSNIGPDGGGFAYDLHQDELAAYPGVFASSVLWGETLEGSARELLGVAEAGGEGEGSGKAAERFLSETLSAGTVSARQLTEEAEGVGINVRTLRRTAEKMGVVREKSGMSGGWFWRLPDYEGDNLPEGDKV